MNQRSQAQFREKRETALAIGGKIVAGEMALGRFSCNAHMITDKMEIEIRFCCGLFCAGTAGECCGLEFFAAQHGILSAH